MTSARRGIRFSLYCLGLLVLAGGSATPLCAQCSTLCGDANLSGTCTSADILLLKDYALKAIMPTVEHGCLDVDNYAGVSLHDLILFTNYVYLGGSNPDCQPAFPALPMGNDPGMQLIYNNLIPPDDSIVTLHVDVNTTTYTQGVSLVLRVLVDGEATEFQNVTAVASLSSWDGREFGDSSSAEIPAGYLMGGAVGFDPFGNPEAGRYAIGKADIKVTSSPQYRAITLELTSWPPGDNPSMLVDGSNNNAWSLHFQPWVVDLTGDANNDRALTSADVIWLVNFVFKSGNTPYPVPAAGDVNCSASVTSADVIGLVNYVFKSGLAPCNVEAECTINLDQWTCP